VGILGPSSEIRRGVAAESKALIAAQGPLLRTQMHFRQKAGFRRAERLRFGL
jgi:hypothetical protein